MKTCHGEERSDVAIQGCGTVPPPGSPCRQSAARDDAFEAKVPLSVDSGYWLDREAETSGACHRVGVADLAFVEVPVLAAGIGMVDALPAFPSMRD